MAKRQQSELESHVQKPKRAYVRKQKPGTFKFVGGPRARSRNGCLTCRKRSKKCDEAKPSCGLCVEKNRECIWPENVRKTPLEMTPQEFRAHFQEHQKQHGKSQIELTSSLPLPQRGQQKQQDGSLIDSTSPSFGQSIQSQNTSIKSGSSVKSSLMVTLIPAAGTVSPTLSPVDLTNSNSELHDASSGYISSMEQLDFKSNPELSAVDNVRRFIKSVNQVKSSPDHLHDLNYSSSEIEFQKHREHLKFDRLQELLRGSLAEVETEYLESFCVTASTLCFSDAHFDRFLESILSIAETSITFRNSIIVWGAVSKDQLFDAWLGQIENDITEAILNNPTGNSFQFFIGCLSSCLLLAKLSHFPKLNNDNKNWFEYLIKSKDLITSYKILDNLDDLHSQLYPLLSFFSFQDLHSSHAFIHGTLLDSQTTLKLLSIPHSESYPPINVVEPLLHVIPEMIELKKQWTSEGLKMIRDPNKVGNHVYTERLNILDYKGTKLDKVIYNTHPIRTDLSFIQIEDFEVHLSLYELYQFTLQLSLRNMVRKYPPNVPENQILMVKIFNLLKYFINVAHVKSSILWSFVVGGCNTVYEPDRKLILELLDVLKKQAFDVANVEKIEVILNECWERNGDGSKVINWFDLAEEHGWFLNLS